MGLINNLPNVERNGWPWDIEFPMENYSSNKIWPKITIVTPSYNQGAFLEETIRSIILQNYPNLEYIIMDGGSKDQTIDIINKYSQWISFWVSAKDNGQSDALVKGFAKSSGELLNWINSDDILCNGGLFHIAKQYLENNNPDFIYGKNLIINENSELIGTIQHPKDNLKFRYLYEMPYGQQACFFSSKIYNKVGGINPNIRFSMDYELYVRIHLLSEKTFQMDEEIGAIRIHHDTKTSNLEDIMRQENGNVFRTFLLSIGEKKYARFLGKLGFENYKEYKTQNKISNKDIKQIFILFIKKIIWYYHKYDKILAAKLAIKLIQLNRKNIFNKHIIKIIKDGKFKIL
jgi:glycosyltransferase involved in cell wall biosynthesis